MESVTFRDTPLPQLPHRGLGTGAGSQWGLGRGSPCRVPVTGDSLLRVPAKGDSLVGGTDPTAPSYHGGRRNHGAAAAKVTDRSQLL